MSDELVTFARPEDDAILERSEDERTIEVRLARWGEVARKTQEGYAETLLPGAFLDVDPATVTLESSRHGGALVGVAEAIMERAEDAVAIFRVAKTMAGDELLELARSKVLRAASVVFAPVNGGSRQRPDGVVERSKVDLRRVAILERGAYPSAAVLAVRSDPEMSETEQAVEQGGRTSTETAPEPVPVVQRADPAIDTIVSRMDGFDARLDRLATIATIPSGRSHDLAAFDSLGDYQLAVWQGKADQTLLQRALHEVEMRRSVADQITDNNAGVLPPGWLMDVKRIVDLGRRAITAFGGPRPLPATGMVVDWPYLSSSNTLIAAQPTGEKNEVQSQRVDIAKGEATLVTYAGYSDISYQLLERSSPSYREAYDRIMLAAWGAVTDAAFCTALEGTSGTTTIAARGMLGADVALSTSAHADDIFDATGHGFSIGDCVVFTSLTGGDATTAALVGVPVWVIATSYGANTFRISTSPGGAAFAWGTADISAGNVAKLNTTAIALRTALAQASVAIEDATGQPASIALAGDKLFLALAGLSDLVPVGGGPSNASGDFTASTLEVNVSGLRILRAPGVSDGKLVVSNREAAAWHEQGPRFITAEDVGLLGRNVGVYSYAAPASYVPAGIVELTLI